MTPKQFSNAVSHMLYGAAMVIAAGTTTVVFAQAPAAPGHHEIAAEPAGPQASAMMAGQHEMAKMAAADKKLADLLARMNAAKGNEKVEAMAAVITELATQRMQMQEQMMRMQSGMMDHMMGHMSAMHGASGMMKTAPPPTPAEKPADADHSAHHPEK